MTLGVTALVLLAALMHACWNALLKARGDTTLNTALLVGAASLLSAPLLAILPLPHADSWPHLLASGIVHQAYFAMVGASYRQGDLSLTYPLMRGVPPLLVAGGGALLLEDVNSPWIWVGVITVSIGILWIGGFPRLLRHAQALPSALALTNAVLIAAYTLIDGMGARLSGNSASYGLWLFFLSATPYVWIVVVRHPRNVLQHCRDHGRHAALGAALSIGAYLIVLWAMTQAPVAAVAALRETSVIFAAVIGALWLREPLGRHRIAGACVVVIGIGLMKL